VAAAYLAASHYTSPATFLAASYSGTEALSYMKAEACVMGYN